MDKSFHCQVCAIEIVPPVMFGSNGDGSTQPAYCSSCFVKGNFAEYTKMTLEDFVPFAKKHCMEVDKQPEEVADKNGKAIPGVIFWRFKKMNKG